MIERGAWRMRDLGCHRQLSRPEESLPLSLYTPTEAFKCPRNRKGGWYCTIAGIPAPTSPPFPQ